MRRRYNDCKRRDGNCTLCDLSNFGMDCKGKQIRPLAWARMAAGMEQKDLARESGIHIRTIQKVESGEADAGNLTARNIIALADALGVQPKDLL